MPEKSQRNLPVRDSTILPDSVREGGGSEGQADLLGSDQGLSQKRGGDTINEEGTLDTKAILSLV